jgi:cell division protein FtsA
MIPVPGGRREICRRDVDHVIHTACSIKLPGDRELLHVIPQDFVVDQHNGIMDPVGMTATRLGTEVHLVSGHVVQIENIVKVIERAGYEVINVIFTPLASACSLLGDEEMKAGCLLIDIGSGVSSYALYGGGGVRASGVIAAGGANVTNDIAVGLRIQKSLAEDVKLRYGLALSSMAGEDEVVSIPGAAPEDGTVRRQIVAAIMEPRCEEIFSMIEASVSGEPHYRVAGGGVVLTGGGSKLEGIAGVAEQVFGMPVRIGRPRGLGGLSEIVSSEQWSAGSGLVLFERDRLRKLEQGRRSGNRLGRMIGNIKKLASMF